MTDSTNPLIERLLRVLEAVQVDDIGLANELSEIRSRLSAPLRVALVGRVSSGKSTLLNALLGQIVAPTDAGECTEVATSFEYGFPERVEIRLVNGTIKEIQLDAQGRLPERLPFPKTEVQDVRVWLANETLHTLTLVDTPGFSSGQTEVDGKGDDDSWTDGRAKRRRTATRLYLCSTRLCALTTWTSCAPSRKLSLRHRQP